MPARPRVLALLLSLTLAAPAALAQTLQHDEAVDGDLSGNPAAPTSLAFVAGGNIVRGDMRNPSDTRDYITFTVPQGGRLDAILQNNYQNIPGGFGDVGYAALSVGATSSIPEVSTAFDFIGAMHTFTQSAGTDILFDMGLAIPNGTGFTPPLGPGTYCFVIQQVDSEHVGYEYEFVIGDSWSDEGCALAGVNGDPVLEGSGFLSEGTTNTVLLTNAAPSAIAGLFLGFASTPVAFKGGTLKPFPFLGPVITNTSLSGSFELSFAPPAGVPGGTELYVQWAIQDAAAVFGVSLSNAVKGVTG